MQRAINSFAPSEWDSACDHECCTLVQWAVREDLDRGMDWTTLALVPAESRAAAVVVPRKDGVMAGLKSIEVAIREMQADLTCELFKGDGDIVNKGDAVARLAGSARDLLTAERTLLNIVGKLSGIASMTRQFVDAVSHTRARILDTRKTTAGWRRLEKYAVRCGGGQNHRMGLYDGVLIKDNHLALMGISKSATAAADAVRQARQFLAQATEQPGLKDLPLEVEVDTLDQLTEALKSGPDIVLLDNMAPDQLRQAVALRDRNAPQVLLEASGGINLQTVASAAETGIDRISVGALTHSASVLDVGLDWT